MDLSILFGSESAAKTLLYIANYKKGYCAEIARTYGVSPTVIQNQLDKFEQNGVLVAINVGRSRVFEINPRYVFKKDLLSMLSTALEVMPREEVKKYYRNRQRPRRKGKPYDLIKD